MQDEVTDASGASLPKYVIGARALENCVMLLQAYVAETGASGGRAVRAGLVVFKNGRASEAVPFGPFEADAFRNWLRDAPKPRGSTPLGRTLATAVERVMASPLSRNHVLVITDGMNTTGPDPEEVIADVRDAAAQVNSTLGVHFIAFDIDASLFDEIREQGVTVVAAADEIQLNEQLSFILERKILLEAEELPAAPESLATE
jgi:hypothetical protein